MPASTVEGGPGPWLLYTRRRPRHASAAARTGTCTQDHAHRIVLQVEQEIAARVQREALERAGVRIRRMPSRPIAYAPPQATTVGLRHRLLDALLFFGRPA